jgi:hypothetical protein
MGALSDDRTGLSFVRVSSKSFVSIYIVFTNENISTNVCTIYIRPLSVQAQYSRLCPISSSDRYNGILVT